MRQRTLNTMTAPIGGHLADDPFVTVALQLDYETDRGLRPRTTPGSR